MEYRIVEHTSDVGLEVEAPTLPALFERAGAAFSDIVFGLSSIEAREATAWEVDGDDLGGLMVAYLSEVLYRFEVEERVFCRYDVGSASDTHLSVQAWGERFESGRHHVLEPVKAVTWHQLEVVHRDGQWHARVILDL
ncbi:MAG TPA: archease [Candidatus Xenobia bacterium]